MKRSLSMTAWGMLGLAACALALAGLSRHGAHAFRHTLRERAAAELEQAARLAWPLLEEEMESTSPGRLDERMARIRSAYGERISVFDARGRLRGAADPSRPMEAEWDPQAVEVQRALRGESSTVIRSCPRILEPVLFVAVPMFDDEPRLVAVVRVGRPLQAVEAPLAGLRGRLRWAALVLWVLPALVILLPVRRWAKHLQTAGQILERREEDRRAPHWTVSGPAEIVGLAASLNLHSERIAKKLTAYERGRREQAALFDSMLEGVIAVDNDGQVLEINKAALDLLRIDPPPPRASIQAAVRNPDLLKLVRRTLDDSEPVDGECRVIRNGRDEVLRVRGAALRNDRGERQGAVLVLSDVTASKQLDQMRRDFVSNVSHELKTPITAILGFAETLQEDDSDLPDESRRFIGIIARQSRRLQAIVEDLLALSRIEHQAEKGLPEVAHVPLQDVLTRARQTCEARAEARGIEVSCECLENLTIRANAALLEQAVVNLLANAIQYSDPGQSVTVRGLREHGEAVVEVRDRGCGIEPQHLDRIFERFYRVDKARSRESGGTGLGLAIVKHIALAHQGRVSVRSTPGEGSTFRLHLPPENG